jgi:hypothetical protein
MTKYITSGQDMVHMIDRYTRDLPGQACGGVNQNGQKMGFVVWRIEAYSNLLNNNNSNPYHTQKDASNMNFADVYLPLEYQKKRHKEKVQKELKGSVEHAGELYNSMWKVLIATKQNHEITKILNSTATNNGNFAETMYLSLKENLRAEIQKSSVVTATLCEANNCNHVEEDTMIDEGVDSTKQKKKMMFKKWYVHCCVIM